MISELQKSCLDNPSEQNANSTKSVYTSLYKIGFVDAKELVGSK